jgi:ferredoxin
MYAHNILFPPYVHSCNNVCPKTFSMEEEYGRARVMNQLVDTEDKVQEAMDTCPVSCIHWVSAPQLTLLEETMGNMERVDAWVLMNGGGKGANLNVFTEASLAWEKRQAKRRDAQQQAEWRWGWGVNAEPAAGSKMQDAARRAATESSDWDDAGVPPRTPGKRVNAAEMAAAARRWRDYQRARRQRNQKLLPGSEAA